jgi:hypothetical protein
LPVAEVRRGSKAEMVGSRGAYSGSTWDAAI